MAILEISTDAVSIGICILGLVVAVWQTIRERNARQMYRGICVTRCKDLVETVRELADSTSQACKLKDEHFDDLVAGQPKAIRPLRQLSDQIHGIYLAENQLIRFCERLNEEHREEFGSPIFRDIKQEILRDSDAGALLSESRKTQP